MEGRSHTHPHTHRRACARTHTHTHAHKRAHTHAHTHARTHTHPHVLVLGRGRNGLSIEHQRTRSSCLPEVSSDDLYIKTHPPLSFTPLPTSIVYCLCDTSASCQWQNSVEMHNWICGAIGQCQRRSHEISSRRPWLEMHIPSVHPRSNVHNIPDDQMLIHPCDAVIAEDNQLGSIFCISYHVHQAVAWYQGVNVQDCKLINAECQRRDWQSTPQDRQTRLDHAWLTLSPGDTMPEGSACQHQQAKAQLEGGPHCPLSSEGWLAMVGSRHPVRHLAGRISFGGVGTRPPHSLRHSRRWGSLGSA